MKKSVKEELLEYINDNKNDYSEELHFHLFNEDYYIIGYYQAQEWLDQHEITVVFSAFEFLSWICKDEIKYIKKQTIKHIKEL